MKETLSRERRVRYFSFFERLLETLSPSERLALYALSSMLAISTLVLLAGLSRSASVEMPVEGGVLREGEVGSARFINPLLTLSQADQDLATLVYSGLMRALPDGSYAPDLAEHYEISENGTVYTFTLRPDMTFHDGTPLTSADVLFTIQTAQNPVFKSMRRADWDGVQVSTPDARTVVFTLPHAYAPFIDNTTIGILPSHLWKDVPAEEFPFNPLNTRPVGSGPYRIASLDTDSTGAATRYDLAPFRDFALDGPYLKRISFTFYPNTEAMLKAWNARQIDAVAGVSPAAIGSLTRSDGNLIASPLPRVFGIFFNQNHAPLFADSAVRKALEKAVDKRHIVDAVLGGYGTVLEGPIPPGVLSDAAPATPLPLAAARAATSSAERDGTRAEEARAILRSGGWTFTPAEEGGAAGVWTKKTSKGGKGGDRLTVRLATADQPELIATATMVADDWRAAGVEVDVQVYSLSELNTAVLRPRAYDAMLFGEVVGRSADLFAFWHSSQRNDPGLNLAMYANAKADTLLSKARVTTDAREREKLYEQFSALVQKDAPAIFLYAPDFLYIVPRTVRGAELGALTSASERFLTINQWYTDTKLVWSLFTTN